MTQVAPLTTVTSRDPQGLKFISVVEDAYNKARLSAGEEAQRVNDASGLSELIASFITDARATDKFKDEVVSSKYNYPPEYKGPRSIVEQINILATAFDLDPRRALVYATNLPAFATFVPDNALPHVGWFAVLKDQLDRELILNKIGESRSVYNYRSSQMDRFRVHQRTAGFLEQIETQKDSDILVVALQLGMLHRGESVNRARELFVRNEYGGTLVMGQSVALTHPERFVRWEELDMDLPGDEFDDPVSDVRFGRAACLYYRDGRVGFGASRVSNAGGDFGSVSGFLPKG